MQLQGGSIFTHGSLTLVRGVVTRDSKDYFLQLSIVFVIITLYVQSLGCCLDYKICTLLGMQYLFLEIIFSCL